MVVSSFWGKGLSDERPATLNGVWGAFVFSPGAEWGWTLFSTASRNELFAIPLLARGL